MKLFNVYSVVPDSKGEYIVLAVNEFDAIAKVLKEIKEFQVYPADGKPLFQAIEIRIPEEGHIYSIISGSTI